MKRFTLEEAQAILPTVEALLGRVLAAGSEAERLQEKAAALRIRIFHSGGLSVDVASVARDRVELEKQKTEAEETIAELHSIGVQVKDLAAGILDFPCEYNGETVLLCWKRGEARIEHWHGVDEGFSSRRKLDDRKPGGVQRERLH